MRGTLQQPRKSTLQRLGATSGAFQRLQAARAKEQWSLGATPGLQDSSIDESSHLVVAVAALEALQASPGLEPRGHLSPAAEHHNAPVQLCLQGRLQLKTQRCQLGKACCILKPKLAGVQHSMPCRICSPEGFCPAL